MTIKIEHNKKTNTLKVVVELKLREGRDKKIKYLTDDIRQELKTRGYKDFVFINTTSVYNSKVETCKGEWFVQLKSVEPIEEFKSVETPVEIKKVESLKILQTEPTMVPPAPTYSRPKNKKFRKKVEE